MNESQTQCQLCLSTESMKIISGKDLEEMIDKVLKIFRFEVNSSICRSCGRQVDSFYDFFVKVQCNQELLVSRVEDGCGESKADDTEHESDPPEREPTNKEKKKTVNTVKRDEEDVRISKYITFMCNLCNEPAFKDIETYKVHKKRVHNETYPIVQCCGRRLANRVRVLNHIEYHHELIPEFKCHHCDKCFKRKAYLAQHVRSHEVREVQRVQCNHCEAEFLYKSQLIKHQVIHMSAEEAEKIKFSQCPDCGKTFVSRHLMQTHHRRIHQQQDKYICAFCAHIFRKKERLSAHILYKHTENPPVHRCQECGVECATQATYKRHIKWYHTEAKKVRCDVCGVTKINEMSLKQHKKFMHEMPRKFACTYCPKGFRRRIELTEHLTIHLGGSLYSCPHCNRNFNSKSNMQTHAKRRCSAAPRTEFNAHLST